MGSEKAGSRCYLSRFPIKTQKLAFQIHSQQLAVILTVAKEFAV